jgi:ParB/RepB/Spo0J family partition protein
VSAQIVLAVWNRTMLWPDNPRQRVDEAALRELAESIRRKGVLQNLVARPIDGDDPRTGAAFEIVSGQRRWRAVERLVREGAVPADFPLPLRVAALDDREALFLAIAENVQRRDMEPWEEAEAFGRLLDAGDTVASIAERLGVSPRLVKSRRALLGLVPEAMEALKAGRLNLGQAGAFSVGAPARQRELLPVVLDRPDYEAARIRECMVGEAVPMEWARFDPALYRGAVIPDLFDERGYAADRALFRSLQEDAVREKVAELARTWSWAEPQWGGYFAPWDYDRDGEPHVAGAVVHLRDDLRVEIHTGLVRRSAPVEPARAVPARAAAGGPASAAGAPFSPSSAPSSGEAPNPFQLAAAAAIADITRREDRIMAIVALIAERDRLGAARDTGAAQRPHPS